MVYACAIATFISTSALAQPSEPLNSVDIMPTQSANAESKAHNEALDTHPPLKISPDKSELIRLEKEAGSIIVGSPAHLSVLADSAKTLVLVPQIPGATYVTILDKQGNVLMQRHVIVASPKKKYVRIRKSCAGSKDDCQPTQVYYCPDGCHKVNVAQEASETSLSGDTSGGSEGGAPTPLPVPEGVDAD